MAVETLDPRAVRRARAVAHGLHERSATLEEVAATWAIQDSPPNAAVAALHARVDELAPGALEHGLDADGSLVLAYDPRSATMLLPASELGAFAAAHAPPDDDALARMLTTATRESDRPAGEVAELAVDAVDESLAAGPLSRDDLHEGLRERLPSDLLPWCGPCGSFHARRPLLVIAVLRGVLVHAGRAGRQPLFARPADHLGTVPATEDRAATVRRLARGHLARSGASGPSDLAAEHGLSPAHGRTAWTALDPDELVPVRVGGGARRFAHVDDLATLRDPPPVAGLRLLPAGDPYLRAKDRSLVLGDDALRNALYRPTGAPGAVLVDGEVTGTWRGRSRSGRLDVEVDGDLPARLRDALVAEAAAVARLRGLGPGRITPS